MTNHVLLAEDEPNIVESLKFVLGRAGYTVTVKENGRDVLDMVIDNPPDVMILDVMLPEIDGFEILRKVRTECRRSDLPVIILTAKGQREDRERAISWGADRFISKPFSNADLVQAVDQLVQRAEAGHQREPI